MKSIIAIFFGFTASSKIKRKANKRTKRLPNLLLNTMDEKNTVSSETNASVCTTVFGACFGFYGVVNIAGYKKKRGKMWKVI